MRNANFPERTSNPVMTLVYQLVLGAIALVWICVFFGARIRRGIVTGRVKNFLDGGFTVRAETPAAFRGLCLAYLLIILGAAVFYAFSVKGYVVSALTGPEPSEFYTTDAGITVNMSLLKLLLVLNAPFLFPIGLFFFSGPRDFLQLLKHYLEPAPVTVAKGSRHTSDVVWAGFIIGAFALSYFGIVWLEYVLIVEQLK